MGVLLNVGHWFQLLVTHKDEHVSLIFLSCEIPPPACGRLRVELGAMEKEGDAGMVKQWEGIIGDGIIGDGIVGACFLMNVLSYTYLRVMKA